ncbi:MAG: type IV pilus assembly protein PilM [Candidatus Eremiobacteraeota bacterium]|nr:type IV pilus assembly protein PilM [Candidatus Eremiobacteraeota bacterium]
MSFLRKLLGGRSNVGGLDLGCNTLKLAQVIKTPTGYQLSKLAIGQTPPQAFKDGVVADARLLADKVREIILNSKINISRVVGAVSGQSVVIRPINMTQMTDRELQHAIRFEAERYLPYPVAEAIISGLVLRRDIEGEEKSMEVLLVAAPNDLVKSTQDVTKMAVLEPHAIDIEPFALARALQLAVEPEVFQKTIALINMGATFTGISIFKGGMLRHHRTVTVAGNSFTKAIGQSLNLSFEEAEKIKKDKGAIRLEKDSSPVAPTTMRIFNVIVPVLTELMTEIQRSFDYYRSRYRGESVDQIVLCGGTALFKNMDAYIGNELGIPCIVGDPLKSLSLGDIPGLSSEEIREMSPSLMVVVGLALRDIAKGR